jgi:hypothetical protein
MVTIFAPRDPRRVAVAQYAGGSAFDLAEASRSSSARLEWIDLTTVPGGDGKPHLYYLTSGPPGGGPSRFRLRVTNTNNHLNFQNPVMKVRLRAKTGPDQSTVIPLAGQGAAPWKSISDDELPDESSKTVELYLDPETRWRAYQPNEPLHWLDVEYHWRESLGGWYYATTSLAFFLMSPVEFLLQQKRLVEERSLNDRTQHAEYWRLLWENSQPTPMTFEVTMQASVTDTATGQVQVQSSTTITRGKETVDTVTTNSELSVGFGIDKQFSLGQKLGTSVSSSLRWSETVARQLTTVASRTRSFTEGHTRQTRVAGTVPAAPPGRRQALYAYPVVGVYEVPLVLYGAPNELGQATRRGTDKVPVVWLHGWGTAEVLK